MPEKRIEVNRCSACPMRRTDAIGNFCGAHMGTLSWAATEPPDWCPLRSGPVLVTLKEGK